MSYLSEDVKLLLRFATDTNGFEADISPEKDIASFVKASCQQFEFLELATPQDYLKALTCLKPLFFSVKSFQIPSSEEWISVASAWLPQETTERLKRLIPSFCYDGKVENVLYLLHLTALAERALGNVYVTTGKVCPFLLRDLLASHELETICSKTRMKLLRVFLGGPFSLNLRNLLWHGFLAPDELPEVCCHALFHILYDIFLHLKWQQFIPNVIPRPKADIAFQMSILKHQFPVRFMYEEIESIESLMRSSSLISKSMLPYLEFGLQKYSEKRYSDALVVLLPQLEHILRKRFSLRNDCPERVMTAQSTEFYTTLDEILAENLGHGKANKMKDSLGESFMVFLIDLFNMPDGPRLRDRLSHGELPISQVDKYVADLVLLAIIRATNHASDSPVLEEDCVPHEAFLGRVRESIASYESLFHPLAFAKRDCVAALDECAELEALLKNGELIKPTESEADESLVAVRLALDEFLSSDYAVVGGSSGIPGSSEEQFVDFLLSRFLATLSRSGAENAEAANLLRQIATGARQTATNLLASVTERTKDFAERRLRSRQRKNYQRLLLCCPVVAAGVRHISIAVLVSIHHRFGPGSGRDFKTYRRRFKQLLQISEKLANFTTIDVHKWDEAAALVTRIPQFDP